MSAWRGRRWVVETDIANCFEAIPHDAVDVGDRGTDRRPPRPQAPARDAARRGDGGRGGQAQRRRHSAGRGDLARACANVYLHRLDRQWQTRGHGVLVRYADDLRGDVPEPSRRPRRALAALRGDPGRARARAQARQDADRAPARRRARGWTSSASITAGCAATRPRSGTSRFLARWPSRQAMQHARDRIRETHGPRAAAAPGRGGRAGPQPLPARLGGLLPLRKLRPSASTRSRSTRSTGSRCFVAKRHKRTRRYGWWAVVHQSPTASG